MDREQDDTDDDDHRIGRESGRHRKIGKIKTGKPPIKKKSSVLGPCGKPNCKGDCDTCIGAQAAETARRNKFGGLGGKS